MSARVDNGVVALSAGAFHILLALAEEDRNGSAIAETVEMVTRGVIVLMPGALYRYLKQMVINGWIAEISGADADGRRKYYRLTDRGRQIARAEAERLDKLVRLARSRKLLSGRV